MYVVLTVHCEAIIFVSCSTSIDNAKWKLLRLSSALAFQIKDFGPASVIFVNQTTSSYINKSSS